MVCPQVIQRFHIGRLPPDQMGLRTWTAFRSLSPMTMLHNLRSYCRLLALVASWVLSVFPLLSAQHSKELMADACSNELHQREQNVLWASQVERRTAGHVYREEEIDTVEGPVHRLLSVDGREPSPSDRTQDDDRLRDLRENPSARLTLKKNREAEQKKIDDLLRAIPDVFLFKDQGKQGNLERLAFSPNPAYKPATYQEAALHALSGVVLIDLTEKRVAQFSGTLTQQVNFAHGLLGHLAGCGKTRFEASAVPQNSLVSTTQSDK